jgi:hypothetical protein
MTDNNELPGLIDNSMPAAGLAFATRDIADNDEPSTGLGGYKLRSLKQHMASTQRTLAYGVVAILCILNLGCVSAMIFNAISVDDLIRTMGALSGIQALAAAATGFYFGKNTQ